MRAQHGPEIRAVRFWMHSLLTRVRRLNQKAWDGIFQVDMEDVVEYFLREVLERHCPLCVIRSVLGK